MLLLCFYQPVCSYGHGNTSPFLTCNVILHFASTSLDGFISLACYRPALESYCESPHPFKFVFETRPVLVLLHLSSPLRTPNSSFDLGMEGTTQPNAQQEANEVRHLLPQEVHHCVTSALLLIFTAQQPSRRQLCSRSKRKTRDHCGRCQGYQCKLEHTARVVDGA